MSVLESLRSTISIGSDKPRYRCEDCGQEFESTTEQDSYWFGCPECHCDDVEQLSR